MHFESTVLPIVIVALVFGVPALVLVIFMGVRSKDRAEMQKTIRMSIEKGQPLPPELIDDLRDTRKGRGRSPMRDIRAGIILMAVAGGMTAWNYIDHGGPSGIAAIPGLIGVALLILGIIGNITRKD
jgi:hypothetical protein